jgi:hypothetical protein
MLISKPVRAVRSYTQQVVAPPHIVFPLLCPVREAEWANGWDPIQVWSASGFVEEDCVFTTPGEPAAVWVVTQLDSDRFFVEMVKVTPGVTASWVPHGYQVSHSIDCVSDPLQGFHTEPNTYLPTEEGRSPGPRRSVDSSTEKRIPRRLAEEGTNGMESESRSERRFAVGRVDVRAVCGG